MNALTDFIFYAIKILDEIKITGDLNYHQIIFGFTESLTRRPKYTKY